MSDKEAIERGYTRRVILDGEGARFAALVDPNADLDDTFRAFDTDNQEWLIISGWLLDNVEDLEETK